MQSSEPGGLRPSPSFKRLSDIHEKAWGKQWPRRHGTILRTDVVRAEQPGDDDAMDIDWHDRHTTIAGGIYVSDNTDIPEQFEYVCLDGVNDIRLALRITSNIPDIIVVRPEYNLLIDAIEKAPRTRGEVGGIVITGQAGIGSFGSQSLPELNFDSALHTLRKNSLPPIPPFASFTAQTSDSCPIQSSHLYSLQRAWRPHCGCR
jgi:hypothetical protein